MKKKAIKATTPTHQKSVSARGDSSKKGFDPSGVSILANTVLEADGRILTCVKYDRYAAIYVRKRGNVVHSYDVFRIKIRPGEKVGKYNYPAREIFPADSDFGKRAKNCLSLAAAEDWFDEFSKAERLARALQSHKDTDL